MSTDKKTALTLSAGETAHSSVLNFFGTILATASSTGNIHVTTLPQNTVTLSHSSAPCWEVDWAHPACGSVIVSCSFDGSVQVWRCEGGKWNVIHRWQHSASVNSVKFAPAAEMKVAAGSSDGTVSVVCIGPAQQTQNANHPQQQPATQQEGEIRFKADEGGVTSVAWLGNKVLSGGCDGTAKIWTFNPQNQSYTCTQTLTGHTDWVRDAQPAPYGGLIATCSQDKTVRIYTPNSGKEDGVEEYTSVVMSEFEGTVWKLSWSAAGNVLAVSCENGKVSLWKQNLKQAWEQVGEVDS